MCVLNRSQRSKRSPGLKYAEKVAIGIIVTDRHKQINKWLRETDPEVMFGILLKVRELKGPSTCTQESNP